MTDKEILINGVNVAECNYFMDSNQCDCNVYNSDCEDSSNCYFKQLAREKQKNKELKNNLKCQHLVLDECSYTGNNCVGMKQCILNWEEIYDELKQNKIIELDRALTNEDKYKQALNDIANISFHTSYDLAKEVANEEIEIIHNKASEVLNEN